MTFKTPMCLLIALTSLSLAGCGASPEVAPPTKDAELTGARLSVDYFGATDVVGFHYVVERVACFPGEAFEAATFEMNVNLLDGILPGMVELLEQTFDAQSGHLGADLFMSLAPGCYDASAIPASAFDGDAFTPSEDCSVASASGIEVLAGATSEATMISQCVGDPIGGIDVVVGINHPPAITVTIDEKFNYECEAVEVCVVAYDVDDDPLEFVWENHTDTDWHSITVGDAELIAFEDGHRVWEQCASIVTRYTDSYDISVSVFDQGMQDGELVRMEELVDEDSSAGLSFPIHTNWVEEPMCVNDAGEAVPAPGVSIERDPTCDPMTAEEYYCGPGADPELKALLCDGDSLIPDAIYPPCVD
jgi:hypothetical protein